MATDLSTTEKATASTTGGSDYDLAKIEELVTAIAEAGPAIAARTVSAGPYLQALVLLISAGGKPLDDQWARLEAIQGIGTEAIRNAAESAKLQLDLEADVKAATTQPHPPEAQIKDLNDAINEKLPGEQPINPLILAAEGEDEEKRGMGGVGAGVHVSAQQPNSPALNDGLAGKSAEAQRHANISRETPPARSTKPIPPQKAK